MTPLEQALARLGDELAFPETPDVAAAVSRRLAASPPGRRFRLPERRTLALVFVAAAVAVAAAFAVPPARTAILDFFGLRGAGVERVETLPEVPSRIAAALELGRPSTLAQARARAAFPPVVPEELGAPDRIYFSGAVPGGKVSLVYEPGPGVPRSRFTGVGVLVTEFSGILEPEFVDKLADQSTRIERLRVGGHPALWLEGGPHVVIFRTSEGGFGEDQARLAGNTLLVERGGVLVRIEGALGRDRAVAIGASLTDSG
jgi:hypothetical protein